ncbi:glycosyltransferase [Rhodococcus sp. WS4]|nr:glycosyltransferase [Rhodococcus sp. WS4]
MTRLRLGSCSRARSSTKSHQSSRALARLLIDRGLGTPVLPTDGLTARDVTVVVPVKDRPLSLGRLLASLPAGQRVVVVDDGSADQAATEAIARRTGAGVVRHPSARGQASARNTCLREVTTPLVAFVDSDVVPDDGWLDTLCTHFADPAVGLVAPRVIALRDVGGGPSPATRRPVPR